MIEITRRENITAKLVSYNYQSWNATFAMLVEYVGQHFKLPSQRDGPTAFNSKTKLGKW
jgi:hypothetical protein